MEYFCGIDIGTTGCKAILIYENGESLLDILIWGGFLNFIHQNGGAVFNEEGTECLVDTPEAAEGVKFLCELDIKYHVMPNMSERRDAGEIEIFKMGRAGMFGEGRWATSMLREVKGLRWGVAPLPKGKIRVVPQISHAFSIYKGTKYPQEAWRFVRYMVSDKIQREVAESGDLIPSLKTVVNSEAFLYDKKHPEEDNQVFLDSLKYSFPVVSRIEKIPWARFSGMMQDTIWGTISKEERDYSKILKEDLVSEFERMD